MRINVGDKVVTAKGSRFTGPSRGTVVGTGFKWKNFRAVTVKKSNGNVRLFLEKNLTTTGRTKLKKKSKSKSKRR